MTSPIRDRHEVSRNAEPNAQVIETEFQMLSHSINALTKQFEKYDERLRRVERWRYFTLGFGSGIATVLEGLRWCPEMARLFGK